MCYSKCRVPVRGPGPGPRYGHVMALVGQRFLLCIGGNDGMHLFIHICHIWFCLLPRLTKQINSTRENGMCVSVRAHNSYDKRRSQKLNPVKNGINLVTLKLPL